VSDPSIYTNYVNVHLSIDKLTQPNYVTWSSDVRLWLTSQRYLDHLAPKAPSLTPTEDDRWETIDVELCVVLKGTLDPLLKQLFCSYETGAQIWEHVKLLYTNDIQRLYGVCSKFADLISSKNQDFMTDYMGKIHAFFHEFNELLPHSLDPATDIEQCLKFFMLRTLRRLADKYSHIRDQILGSLVVPTLTSIYSTLLRVPEQPNIDIPTSVDDSSTLASHHDDQTRPCKQGKGVLSVNIMASSVTRLTSVMHYMSVNIVASQVTRLTGVMHCMVVILALLQLFRPTFPHLRLLGILLLFYPIHMLCSTNFSSGIRINNLLVPLYL